MKGIEKVLFIIFVSLFFLGIAVGLTGRVICIRSNEDYDVIQPELFAPDAIAEVLYDEELHQLYVCYNDASYVNVYSEQGEFLWAVSTPYLKNVYFEIREDKLYVYNSEAYVYSLSDGVFITVIENVE